MVGDAAAYQFDFSGGALCLDFANTVGDRPRNREEHLNDWRDLVAWGFQAGLLSAGQAAVLRAAAAKDARASEKALARAKALREALFRIFAELAAGRRAAPADVETLNAHLASAMPHARIQARDAGFGWTWAERKPTLDRLLWPVVRSAAEMLVSPEHVCLRECASDVCSWLFIDHSPTQRRRWCSMKTCGNRAKARAFYARQRETA
jgi:predicted RNA-binding Zn ribbon-like protein